MIGKAPEIVVQIDKIDCNALVDTGSQVTTLAYSFFQNHFDKTQLQDLQNLVRIESVGGNTLPYHGFFEAVVSIPVANQNSISESIPVIVVPDTSYNKSVPLLLGTNVLHKLLSLPDIPLCAALHVARQALKLEARHLAKTNGVFSHVVAAQTITVPAKSGVVVNGRTTITIPIRQQIALIQPVTDSIAVLPAIVNVKQGGAEIPVEILNESNSEICIPKGEQIAQLHQASIQSTEQFQDPEFLNSFNYANLQDTEITELKSFLAKHRDVFALKLSEMGCTNVTTHKIEMVDDTPVKEKVRPIPPGMYDEIRSHIAELLSAGVIRESKSPFSANMVCVRKKDGSLRLAQDFRPINKVTKRDAYSLANIDVLLDSLKGATYFASLDLLAGYHQVEMEEEHKERTAFSAGPFGFFEYCKMPFGLTGAPATFQRCMDKVLEGLTMSICAVYLDDVIVYGKTKEELFERLGIVFDRFRQSNLKLKPKKCRFLQRSIEFLGHKVSEEGITVKDDHITAVTTWPVPTNVKQLQTFLGFTNFFRRYIKGYAGLVQPLLELLRGHTHTRSKSKFAKSSSKRSRQRSSKTAEAEPWHWGEEQQKAFDNVKQALVSPPLLTYPDFSKEFILHVDASRLRLGAVLYQQHDSGLKVLAYASKSLSPSERNYSAHKLEFLALKWAIATKFTHYLYGKPFSVYTDHNPLTYILTTAKLDATGHRWLSELSQYEFQIFYKPGRQNRAADGLSRRPDPEDEQKQCSEHIRPEVLKEICTLLTSDGFSGVAEGLGTHPDAMVNAIPVVHVTTVDWVAEQRKDPELHRVLQVVADGTKLTDRQRKRETGGVMRLLSHWDSLVIRNDVLYKQSQTSDGVIFRLIVPKHMQQHVLTLSHDDMGHLGRDKTMSVARERYFWVGLGQSVESKIQTCPRCVRAKAPHLPARAPLCSITTTRPLELVCMDFLSLENSKGGHNSVLVITDHYTKYACAFPTRNQEAKTVAKLLVEEFIVHYGIPERLHSDQGRCFDGKIIRNMCKMMGIEKSRTTPYHPEGDGITERFNRTLISMLKTLEPDQKQNWKAHVAPLVHAYNCTRHDSTGFTPFYLMFGRTPRLPLDIFLGIQDDYQTTVKSVRDNLEAAYEAANKASREASKKQARNYDKKVRGPKILIGDLVLVKNVGLKGKHKLADRWKQEIHVVLDQPNSDIPVFRVRPEKGGGERVLHRNFLLPISLPILDPKVDHSEVRESGRRKGHSVTHDKSDSEEEQSESDSEVIVYEYVDSQVPDNNVQSVSVADLSPVSWNPPAHTEDRVSFSCESPGSFRRTFRSTGDAAPAPSTPDSVISTGVPSASLTPESVGRNSSGNAGELGWESSPRGEAERDSSPVGSPVEMQGMSPHQQVEEHVQSSPTDEVPLRRSAREVRRPTYLQDYVSCQQTVQTGNWQFKVHVLLQLLSLFPLQQREILNSILYVMTHSQ